MSEPARAAITTILFTDLVQIQQRADVGAPGQTLGSFDFAFPTSVE